MGKTTITNIARAITVAASVSLFSLQAAAGPGHGSGMAPNGQAGKASEVSRTIEVVMYDNYYEPESISVKAGETIRFKIKNAGELVHEFNIGTAAMHADHQKEMMMMMQHNVLLPDRIDRKAAAQMQKDMGHGMHNDPNSVLLEPGKSGEVIWAFPKDGDVALEYGCNVPGHYESGMHGQFKSGHGS
jgi:uncharacterized cupredoxin-like copper-binding protein